MSLLTQAYLLETYGPRLSAEQVAEVLGVTKHGLHHARARGTLTVPMYTDSGRLWTDYRDLAAYLDTLRETARAG